MQFNNMHFDEAFKFVRSKRAYAEPNSGFMKQLKEFEQDLIKQGVLSEKDKKNLRISNTFYVVSEDKVVIEKQQAEKNPLLNKTMEEMIDELQHCQKLIKMQENKYRPLRVNRKGQIRRIASTTTEARSQPISQELQFFPQMKGQMVTSTKFAPKPPMDQKQQRSTLQAAAGLTFLKPGETSNQLVETIGAMEKPQMSHADNIVNEFRNPHYQNLRQKAGSLSRPPQVPLKTGNVVLDSNRQVKQLAKWENSISNNQSQSQSQLNTVEHSLVPQTSQTNSILQIAQKEEREERLQLFQDKKQVKFDEEELSDPQGILRNKKSQNALLPKDTTNLMLKEAGGQSKRLTKLFNQYQVPDDIENDEYKMKQMLQKSENVIAAFNSKIGLNKRKNDIEKDLIEYEQNLRSKLDKRQQSQTLRSSYVDDSKSFKSTTSQRQLSQGKEKSHVKFDEELIKSQMQNGKVQQWKNQLAEIKERNNASKNKNDTMSRAVYARADAGGIVATNKGIQKLKNNILAEMMDKDRHGLLMVMSTFKR